MAQIVGGLATSHVPSIGIAIDRGDTQNDYWKPLFDGYLPARRWLRDIRPDLAVVIYNDHGLEVFLDKVPTFGIGTAPLYPSGDEGWGPRPLPPVPGDPASSWALVDSLVEDEFDVAMFQELQVDHGFTVPMTLLWDWQPDWPVKTVPVLVNTIQYPFPTARRCHRLGRALRRAIDRLPDDLRVVVVGTGGMSHQLQGERAGFMNPAFDRMFLDKLGPAPEELTRISRETYIREAGSEGAELIMWLVMRGAMDAAVREVHRHYHISASLTAAGLVCYENAGG